MLETWKVANSKLVNDLYSAKVLEELQRVDEDILGKKSLSQYNTISFTMPNFVRL